MHANDADLVVRTWQQLHTATWHYGSKSMKSTWHLDFFCALQE